MKPNECGAIILFDRKWAGAAVIFAIPVGARIPDDTFAWLMAYSREKQIPLIWSENFLENGKFIRTKRTGYGPPAFILSVRNARKNEAAFML